MPAGMASKGENINHFNGVRLRILGTGTVNMQFESLPDNDGNVTTRVMVPLDLDALTQTREPFKKVNFMQQRSRLRIQTTEIDEVIKINRLIIFARPVYTNFPG